MFPKTKHLLHPLRTAKTIAWRIDLLRKKRQVEQQFADVRRDTRDRCWCGGRVTPMTTHKSFGSCDGCGGWVNMRPPLESELSRLYTLEAYWQERQVLRSTPPIEQRANAYREDGRVGAWLALIEQFGPSTGKAIEIGCAPGVLLGDLKQRGYDVQGVEVDPAVSAWIEKHVGVPMLSGFFPGMELPRCDLFMAFDVLEHSPHPERFVKAAADLLNPDGVLIIQTGIDRGEFDQPFGPRQDMFDDVEHLFLFSNRSMELLAEQAGLTILDNARRLWVAGEFCVMKKA